MMECKRRSGSFVLAAGLGLALVVGLLVGLSQQFPGLLGGQKTSVELLEDLFEAPFHTVADPTRFLLEHAGQSGVILFIRSSDLPQETEDRLVAHVAGEGFTRRTIPFVYYLYGLYGSAQRVHARKLADLAYPGTRMENRRPEPAALDSEEHTSLSGLGVLVRNSPALRQQASIALRLYDALFLQLKPGFETEPNVRDRYREAAYDEIKALVRGIAHDTLLRKNKDREAEEGESYEAALEEILSDDERLGVFIHFFTDFVRQLSDSWLESFLHQEQRKERRLEWVREQLEANRFDTVSDYALAQSQRRRVFHLVVDGLQGLLLEGMAELSQGDLESAAARYVTELVQLNEHVPSPVPAGSPEMPQAVGEDLRQLAESGPQRPDFLATFKHSCFAPEAGCVVVHVATVDTPSISVRNLPIVQSGHGAAGPYGTGIPNFSYLDRGEGASGLGWYFWGSDVLYMPDIFANREDRIPGGRRRQEGPGAQTLFERLWRYNTVSFMATLDEGALEKVSAEVGLVLGELQRDFLEQAMVLRLERRGAKERELDRRRRFLIEYRNLSHSFLGALLFDALDLRTFREHAEFIALHEDEGLPDYLLWYNPWPDHFAHAAGPYSDAIVGLAGEYDRLDHYLGKMVQVYENSTSSDRTLFGVVSDHGLIHTPYLVSTDELLFQGMKARGLEVRYKKLTQDEGGLPALRDRRQIQVPRPYDAVVGSTAGGSYIIDLFNSEGLAGNEAAWHRHPDYLQLSHHTLLSGQPVNWIAQLRERLATSMDLALVREYGPEPGEGWPGEVEAVVRIVTPDRGDARIVRLEPPDSQGERYYRYEILGSTDPLHLLASVRAFLISGPGPSVTEIRDSLGRCIEASQGCADSEWQELLSFTLRPDVIHQYSQIYDSERAGTINVFPLGHIGMNSSVPGRHAGEMFGEKNGTQIYWGAGLRRERVQTARNGSLPVTLYHWLVGDEEFRAPDAQIGVSAAEQFAFPSLLGQEAFAPLKGSRTDLESDSPR